MESSDKMWIWLLSIGCATVVTLVLGLFTLSNYRAKIFIENGFSLQTVQGVSGIQWVKPDREFHILPEEK